MRRMIIAALIAVALVFVQGVYCAAADEAPTREELLKRVEALEKEVAVLKELIQESDDEQQIVTSEMESVKESMPHIHWSGWMDLLFQDSSMAGAKSTFDQNHLYLIGDANINSKTAAYMEIEYEHSPQMGETGNKGAMYTEQVWFDYTVSDAVAWRLGHFITPYGLMARSHWNPLQETVMLPLDFTNQLLPLGQTGVEFHGRSFSSRYDLDYSVYVANGKGAPAVGQEADNLDANSNKAVGFDLKSTFDNRKSVAGISGMDGVDSDTGLRELTGVLYFKRNQGPWQLQMQGLLQRGDVRRSNMWEQISYAFDDRFKLVARYDRQTHDAVQGLGDEHRVVTGALNFQLNPNMMFKTEYHRHLFDDPMMKDYGLFAASVSLVF